jgi:GNAT superfamily N-acetyltransferase
VVNANLVAERKALIQRHLSTRTTRPILEPVTLEDMPEIMAVARVAYGPKLLPLCLETLNFHAECLRYGLNDGRTLYQLRRSGGLVGVCGLHRYLWGPPAACWISWFFIDPSYRGRWIGFSMFSALLHSARERGVRTLYIETPSAHPEYSALKTHLDLVGFTHEASIIDYYEEGVNLLIYKMVIQEG